MTSALVPFRPSVEPVDRASTAAPQSPEIHAVCLDIDDTLIDFTASARNALCELIGRDDLWPAWQRITDEHSAMVVSGELDHDAMRHARTKAFLAAQGAHVDDETAAAMEERRLARMTRGWRPFPDAVPCLDWLRAAGLRIAAVTNASGPHQRARLTRLGLSRFIDVVVSAGELGAAKPDPVIFHTACAHLGAPPGATLHVGDRLDVDAQAARDAGLRGVWLDRDHAAARAGEVGVPVIETLADLPALLVSDFRTPTLAHPSAVPRPRG